MYRFQDAFLTHAISCTSIVLTSKFTTRGAQKTRSAEFDRHPKAGDEVADSSKSNNMTKREKMTTNPQSFPLFQNNQ